MVDESSQLILVVDDNPKNVQVLGAVLSQEGYLINVARNGRQALDMVTKSPPDLILLDVMMPEMDGYETCQHLKAEPATQEIPVIFLTARTEKEAAVEGFNVGAADYVTKPFDSEELLARVSTHLELRKKTRKLRDAYEELSLAHAQQERLQLELLEAERLRTLLAAAGGAAHEINQPLQVITMQLELLSLRMDKVDPQIEPVAEALRQASRIGEILQSMKDIQCYRSTLYPGGSRIVDYAASSERQEDAG